MKVTKNERGRGATIQLSEMETGYLRAVLFDCIRFDDNSEGFPGDLFRKLDNFNLPLYEREHPLWRKV